MPELKCLREFVSLDTSRSLYTDPLVSQDFLEKRLCAGHFKFYGFRPLRKAFQVAVMANIISDDRRFPALFICGKLTRIWQDNQIETAKEYAAERSKWISKENLRLCWVPWHDVSKLIISAAQNFHKPDISIFTDDEREYLAHQIWDKTGLFPDWSTHKPEPRKFTSPTDEIEWDEPVVISPWVGPRGCWERKTWS